MQPPEKLERVAPTKGKMAEVEGKNLWSYPAEVRCITTNGIVKRSGAAVMGAGSAKQAKLRYPGIEMRLGRMIAAEGNNVHIISNDPLIVSFPTKHRFVDKADLSLIRESACQLVMMADRFGWKSIVLPRPGCGNGGRWWLSEVRPILIDILDERFTVIHDGGSTVQVQTVVKTD